MVTIRLQLSSQSLDAVQTEPVRVVDDRTERVYYLVSAEQFEKISPLLAAEEPRQREWSDDMNVRRMHLIDKSIQKTLDGAETIELEWLTGCLRDHFDTEEMVPLEGAKQLHQKMLSLHEPRQAAN